ncbi:acetyl-CoA C-acetyltransferase family protein [Burkholderia pseudomallei TSV 25]|uniref:acetyl-CoA C-acetyltransferase n=1 Tax=Burkholderia pseudomallei TaxID=28450 RepID=UPI00050F1F76|nr:acetyl-CoA C-acetyltransferase [Burkholderia pseudomallei]AIV47274.1 acetyl-CoA C-acyltransferase family protein [Burkholderia pseudomallei TSV 48]KGC24523.1 acetyl-CoA C-acetyltransferase family protein [Burkholderia pseudomallei]KGC61627.1 acetyl-CoA C-acetyltransferase family protein [Burkholderia pseudomallei]KGW12992.1 acetyl-CoA C-acetyltransferase family protein [Burkholderia pseudomallei TSV 25]KIX54781.1 acetyl-CoA acetyltransferase [Burkholderia pseudomallei]
MTAVDQDPIVIASAARTPIAGFQGEFASLAAPQLGAAAIAAALERTGLQPEQIDEAVMGCVLPAGQGQAPARQAALGAKLPLSVGCTTINKMCGSGMRAAMFAHDMLVAGSVDVIVAGGMESMTNAPYLLPKARAGMRMGHGQVLDHMFLDGLEDAYDKGRLMGTFAEECAGEYAFSRDAQDAFAIESLARAKRANEDGSFAWEIAPVTVAGKKGDAVIARDEQPFKANPEKIPTLKPAFSKTGTVTAANSSSISDGAAALVMMRASTANRLGLAPLARVVGHSTFAQAPSKFTTAPVGAIRRLFEKNGWRAAEVDLYEINEAFAVVTMAAMKEHGLPHEKVNVNGGACALGHPIGASGARILVTLIGALRARGAKRGVASLCIGGGEATAMGIELI